MAEGTCRVCAEFGPLTEEHVPPRAAFNDFPFLWTKYVDSPTGPVPITAQRRGGLSFPVLCGRCNGLTGVKYGTEYVRLVKEIADRADRVEAGETVEFPVRTFPLRIVKQALTILVASTSEPLTQEYPALIELILNRDATGLPEGLRLFCFIPVIRGVGKVTGRSVMISPEHSVPVRLAEASLWPLGWVITFAGVALAGAFEVTDWARKPFARREIVKGEV